MKVITCNLNGIRAATRKGFFDWIKIENPDFICVQETKAQMHILKDLIYRPDGYYCAFSDAEKKGYSGVGIYSKFPPDNIIYKSGLKWADNEGRYIEAVYGNLHVISLYLPSGSSSEERQQLKYEWMDFLYNTLFIGMLDSEKSYIICGDFNIVHKEIDIKNWKANQKNSGCLPKERLWLDTLVEKIRLADAFREINSNPYEYSWWSNRARAWDNNVGWRIDYQFVSSNLKNTIHSAMIYKYTRFSDHAPVIIDYDI